MNRIDLVTLLVEEYDDALAFYVDVLGFAVREDTRLDAHKRWVVVEPPAPGGTGLLLARAANPAQRGRVGDQTGGRVGFFLRTLDFAAEHARLTAAGVHFEEVPREEPYGTVAVFQDPYGNRWDLIQGRAHPPDPHELLARYHRAMLESDADALAGLYAVDGVHEFPFAVPGLPGRFTGREEIRAGHRALWDGGGARVTEIRDVVVHRSTDPEVLTAEHTVAGTLEPGSRPFRLAGLLVLRVRDGRLVHVRDYLDGLGLARVGAPDGRRRGEGRPEAIVTALDEGAGR